MRICHCCIHMHMMGLRLQQRNKQLVPKTILQELTFQNQCTLGCSCKPIRSLKAETSFSAIGQHPLQNLLCAHKYNDGKFSILAQGHTALYLSILEATYHTYSSLSRIFLYQIFTLKSGCDLYTKRLIQNSIQTKLLIS